MNLRACVASSLFASLTVAALTLSGCGGGDSSSSSGVTVNSTRADGTKLSADDKAAADFLRTELEKTWVKTGDGWVTELQQLNMLGQVMPDRVPDLHFRQFREFKYTVVPEQLTEAMKLNGTDYRGRFEFEQSPERYYREVQTWEGSQGWSQWKDGNPAWGALAIERRKGEWVVQDSDLFEGKKPDPSAIPAAK